MVELPDDDTGEDQSRDRTDDQTDDRTDDHANVPERPFEREVYLSRTETAAFLRDLADQIEAETRVTISGDDWTIPFPYREPVEVEVEYTDHDEGELEIELELTGDPGSGEGLSVE